MTTKRLNAICRECGIEFTFYASVSRGKYCSLKCSRASDELKKTRLGVTFTEEHKINIRLGVKKSYTNGRKSHFNKNNWSGEDNPSWKGSSVEYGGLHKWINRNYGKPKRCDHCKNDKLQTNKYEWANKSGDYKRVIEDWLRLCTSCHKKYDKIVLNFKNNGKDPLSGKIKKRFMGSIY